MKSYKQVVTCTAAITRSPLYSRINEDWGIYGPQGGVKIDLHHEPESNTYRSQKICISNKPTRKARVMQTLLKDEHCKIVSVEIGRRVNNPPKHALGKLFLPNTKAWISIELYENQGKGPLVKAWETAFASSVVEINTLRSLIYDSKHHVDINEHADVLAGESRTPRADALAADLVRAQLEIEYLRTELQDHEHAAGIQHGLLQESWSARV